MTIEHPLYLQTKEYSARQDRFLVDYLFTEGVTDAGAGQLLVTQRALGPTMSVDVAAGTAVIDGDDAALQGAYLVRVTAAENVVIPAPPVSNSRIDLVVLRVRDSTATGGDPGLDGATLEVVSGVAAASPVAPATPDTALVLARVTVAAGAVSIVTANITDQRTQVNKAGIGTQAEPMTTAERDALTGGDLFTGRQIFNTTDGALQTYGGGSLGWVGGKLDVQTFTASGTWTRPQGAKTVYVTTIGAGGAGGGTTAASNGSSAGGGGAVSTRTLSAADLTATVAVTVGAGGVGSTGAGTAGGSSSFGSYVAAYGGAGGAATAGMWGGGGGGTGGTGVTGGGSTGANGGAPDAPLTSTVLGSTGGSGGNGGLTAPNNAGRCAEYGGGGGAAGISGAIPGVAGGSSLYGGGGGGSGSTSAGQAGGAGGNTRSYTPGGGGAGGVATGGSGAAGGYLQGGGGGAGGGTSAQGGNGGSGGVGGGGGSGGSRASGQGTSSGGSGGRGEVIVLTTCL